MERAGLLNEMDEMGEGKMIGSIGQQSPMTPGQAAQMIKNAPEGHLAVSISDEDLGDVNHNISKKDALQTLDWYHNSEKYSSRIDAGEQLAFPITYGAESTLYVTDEPHNYPNYDGPGSSSYMNENDEMGEGEMVADEASASSEIKEFMEAHCTVEELDQMYEYLQEMMKRVAETAKEDGKRYAKLAKKMARK